MSDKGAALLVVDDDPGVAAGIAGLLSDEGYRVVVVHDAAAAYAALQSPRQPLAAVLLDIRMPKESGLDLLARLPRPLPAPVIVLSGEASAGEAVAALRLGATDFIEKPPAAERILTAVKNAVALYELSLERERLLEALAQPGNLVGESAAMEELRRLVAKVGPSDAVVLVTGETGSGKERVARALHLASGRTGRFVAVNCAAIPQQLLESELFGYERGAFSGAVRSHLGRIAQAQRGTVLLDEIGDMPLELQAKLLRVLEQREVEPLGCTAPVPIDTRFVAATHRDLRRAVAAGAFREDLFFRLNVFPLAVPPLRARVDDILPLARAFAAELAPAATAVTFTPEAEAMLRAYGWPGNVRELRNLMERLTLLRADGPFVVGADSLAAIAVPVAAALPRVERQVAGGDIAGIDGTRSYHEIVEAYERAVLEAALERSQGNIAAAARLLKLDRGNLHRRLKALKVRDHEP